MNSASDVMLKPRIFFHDGKWHLRYGSLVISRNSVREVWLRFVLAYLPQAQRAIL